MLSASCCKTAVKSITAVRLNVYQFRWFGDRAQGVLEGEADVGFGSEDEHEDVVEAGGGHGVYSSDEDEAGLDEGSQRTAS